MSTAASAYAHPEVLVGTDWVARHLNDPNVRIVESNEDPLLYPPATSPAPSRSIGRADLNDQVRRDYVDRAAFEKLNSNIGVTPETTVVFYGDKNNWWATYAYWVYQLFGHKNAKVMDGGRLKWEKEGREMTRGCPPSCATKYHASERDDQTNPRLPRPGRQGPQGKPARSLTSAARRSTPASARICPSIPRKACSAAATSRARRA